MNEGHEGVEDTWEVAERALSDGTRCKMEDMNRHGIQVERVIMSAQKLTYYLFFPSAVLDDWVFEPFQHLDGLKMIPVESLVWQLCSKMWFTEKKLNSVYNNFRNIVNHKPKTALQ